MMTAPSDCDLAGTPLAQEARLLVALLRSARLSLLFGEPGANKSEFLQASLLPLLQRRIGDQPTPPSPPRETGVVVPFPDRRKRSSAARRKREVVVLFDDWSGTPLSTLDARLRQAARPADSATDAAPARLAERIQALDERFDVHFIVVLDRFEEFLRLPLQREGVTEFTVELIEALNAPQLSASFLLSLNEDARPALAGLRHHVPGFDDFSLKLPAMVAANPSPVTASPAHEVVAPMPAVARALHAASPPSPTTAPTPIKPPTPLRPPIKTQDVYTLIEDTLNRTATDNDCEPFQGSQPGALAPDVVKPPGVAPFRTARKVSTPAWPDEADTVTPEPLVSRPRRSRRPKPTLIERWRAFFSRLRRQRQSD